jgi:hypothetical protein
MIVCHSFIIALRVLDGDHFKMLSIRIEMLREIVTMKITR